MTPTKEQIDAVISATTAVAEMIRVSGSIPSGELYALVMGTLSLNSYNAVIGTLKRAKLVEERSYLLTWIGPKFGVPR